MDSFIKSPNLPENNVSLGIIDGRVRKSIQTSLEEAGVHVILGKRCENLYEEVSYHPDMYMHHIGSDVVVAAPNAPKDTMDTLKDYGFEIVRGNRIIENRYPRDIGYNVARIGDYALCNVKYTDEVLINLLSDRGVKIVDVKQGYAKCSICVVDEGAIITSDEGIIRALRPYDFEILKITPGNISLFGMSYGFIGGATGMISKGTLVFAGNAELHPDYKKIIDFLDKFGKKVKSLDGEKIMDVGTFIPLKEYCI